MDNRGGVLEDVLGLKDLKSSKIALSSARGLWTLKSLASKPQVLKNCPVLSSRTALFFESLKFCWKAPETCRKFAKTFFCFPQVEIA